MKPLISVKIPTYNCAKYLIQTINSILDQKDFDLDLLDIEVIDDCSTKDNPELVVNQFGDGRVKFFRQHENVGAVKNFNTCIQRSKTEYIHILHGDDFIENNFYLEMYNEILLNEHVGIYSSRCNFVNETSNIIGESIFVKDNNIDIFIYQTPIQFSSIIFNSAIVKSIGGFDENLVHLNDRDLWLRIFINSGWKHVNKKLSNYRIFEGNDTSKLIKSGKNIIDYNKFYIKHKNIFKLNKYKIERILFNIYKNQIKVLSIVEKKSNRITIKSIIGFRYFFYKLTSMFY